MFQWINKVKALILFRLRSININLESILTKTHKTLKDWRWHGEGRKRIPESRNGQKHEIGGFESIDVRLYGLCIPHRGGRADAREGQILTQCVGYRPHQERKEVRNGGRKEGRKVHQIPSNRLSFRDVGFRKTQSSFGPFSSSRVEALRAKRVLLEWYCCLVVFFYPS